MHISNSAACVALIASLMVGSASAAAVARTTKITKYACDNSCTGCKISELYKDLAEALAVSKAGIKNAAGEVNSAYCYHPSGAYADTVAQRTTVDECTKKATTNKEDGEEAAKYAVTVKHYTTPGCGTASEAHTATYVDGQCYTAVASSTNIYGWGAVPDTSVLAFKYSITGTAITAVTRKEYNAANCGSSQEITVNQAKGIMAGAQLNDCASNSVDPFLKFVSVDDKTPVIREIQQIQTTGTGQPSCNNVDFIDGIVPTLATGAPDGVTALRKGYAAAGAGSFITTTGVTTDGTATASTAGTFYVNNYAPRGKCVGPKDAKMMYLCPTGADTPASSADSSADSTAAATTTAAAVVTTTAAAATTTAAASSASAVSAIAAFAAAVLCVVA